MNTNLRKMIKEKRESPMKRFLMPATALAAMKKVAFAILCATLLMLFAAPAWAANECDGALNGGFLGTAFGCGVVINVTAVDASGNALAFTVTNVGNGNPFDANPNVAGSGDDTLIGIVNNSTTTALKSITLTSPDLSAGGLFAFEADGICFFNPAFCPGTAPGAGYGGPLATFGPISPDKTTGTVNFSSPLAASGGTTFFALEGTPGSLTGVSQAAVLTFKQGTNSSAIGTFNCTSEQTPCPDANAHSMKFTIPTVTKSFQALLTATEFTPGNGFCDNGIPDDSTDPIDCRFIRFFGEPAFNPSATSNANAKVPSCYPYSHGNCVVYSVIGAPDPAGFYSGFLQEKIAWNNVVSAPAGHVNSPRLYDDPSKDFDGTDYPHITDPSGNNNVFPYVSPQVEDSQFVFDITTFFDPRPNTVGTDPTTGGGGTKTFNDYVIAFPLSLALVQQPINSDGSSVFNAKRGVIPVKFTYSVDGAATCNLSPATILLTRLSGANPSSTIDEGDYIMGPDNGLNFRISGCQYIYNLDAKSLGVGTYLVQISINSKVVGSAFFALK